MFCGPVQFSVTPDALKAVHEDPEWGVSAVYETSKLEVLPLEIGNV